MAAPSPPRATKPPKTRAPAKSCDCHFYIFGPPARYPMVATRGYTPRPALVPEYGAMIDTLGIERMVIVHPSVYGSDNSCSLDAMAALGERCRMVAVVDAFVSDAQLKQMDAAGVRGVRFNLISMGGPSRNALEAIARRIAPLGWHVQVYVEGKQLAELAPILEKLPVPVVVDHMGSIMTAWGLNNPSLRALRKLIDGGHGWVKLCGYRSSSAGHPYDDVTPLARALIGAAAERCLWGSDWPHPNISGEPPDDGELLDLLGRWAPSDAIRHKILVDNPAALYGFPA
jgi:predicted TIM-barrel fold metal-dependent hydrolase